MAIHHPATVTPTKDELLASWVPTRPWYDGPADATPCRFGSYRFDDPAGEVGVETHLLRTDGGPVLQVPLTYRGAPLAGAEAFLVGTMEHSTLGSRWIYDATGDPVYAATLAATVLCGGREADLFLLEDDGTLTRHEPSVRVQGSGSSDHAVVEGVDEVVRDGGATVIRVPGLDLRVLHVLGRGSEEAGETLVGTWAGQDDPVLLASARPLR